MEICAVNRKAIEGKKIVIYGFGISGKWLAGILDIEYFVDTDSKKWNQTFNGKAVKSPSSLLPVDENTVVIVTIVDIFDVVPFLDHYKIPFIPLTELLNINQEFSVGHNSTLESDEFVRYSVKTVLVCQDASLRRDFLYLRSVDLVITEKCTLKCKDCANLMQFYEDPKTYSVEFVLNGIAELAAKCDLIHEVRVIGGEPFLNKDIYPILDAVASYNKINKIVVYTNGMVPPSEQKLLNMKNGLGKLVFSITDYAELGRNLEKTVATVRSLGIPFRVHPPEHWTDSGRILTTPLSQEESLESFAKCCGKNLYTLIGENLYRCPFAANAEQFRGIPLSANNSVSVFKAKADLKAYAYGIPMIDACRLCPGRSFDAPIITPATQTRKALPYKVYSLSEV